MFCVDVAKVDPDIMLLHCCKYFILILQVFYFNVASLVRDLNVSCNMKQMLRRVFFLIINGWLTIFFNIFLMLRTVVFCVADNFRMLLFDILLDRWRLSHASKPPYFFFVLKQIPSHVYNNALLVFLRRLARDGP